MKPRPPRAAEWVLRLTLPARERDAILGDLAETFAGRGGERPRHPRLWYWAQTLLFAATYSARRLTRSERDDGDGGADRRSGTTLTSSIREGWIMGDWVREFRVAARSLWKRPGFVAAVVGTLALGIGANTAIFSVVNGALLQPLDFENADRIVWLSEWWKDQSTPGGSSMNPANFVDLRESSTTLEHMSMYQWASANLSGGDRPERVRGMAVGRDFFQALGVEPVLGRDFTAEDDRQDAPGVVILTWELWQDRFGGDRDVLGRTLELNAVPHTVIGILPEGTEFPGFPRLFTSLQVGGVQLGRGGRNVNGVARLAPDATLETAREELMAHYARLEEAYPQQNENWSAWADPLDRLVVRESHRDAIALMSWSVALVLLIACVNVANLLLVRTETRQRELAVRVAMGAGRARLLPHFLSESLLLSLVGGALGVALGYWGVQGITTVYGDMLPRPDEIRVDATVLGFAVGLSLVVGVLVALVPALRIDVNDLQKDLKEGARGASTAGSRLRQSLVVGELAVAVVLLGTAGLLLNSFWRVAGIDVGLEDPDDVLVSQLQLPYQTAPYDEADRRVAFIDELLREVEALPGVRSAGVTSRLPLYGGNNFSRVEVVGDPDRFANFVEWRIVTPGFFDAVGVDLLQGRMIGPEDAVSDTLRTILVTREFARQVFPGGDPLGQRIDPFSDGRGLEVVGVVDDIRDMGHEQPAPPGMYAMYGPATANATVYLMTRTEGDPLALVPALRRITTGLDADLPLYGTRTLDDVVAQRLGGRKFSLALLLIFAGMAVLLGAIGIYGVMSYAVAQRTREMGVRLALGAKRVDVIGLVLKHGLRLTIFGVGLGLLGSVGSTRLIEAQLFNVESSDPLTYVTVVTLLAGVALLATYLPARRASSTDPAEALRAE